MAPEYISYLEKDCQLRELVGPVIPRLRSLSSEQIETLVFYLKSLHAYYPSSENHVAHFDRFSERLQAIRESAPQVTLQRQAATRLFKAMATCVAAGVVLSLSVVAWLANAGWGVALLGVSFGLFVFAEARYGKPALEAAKEQDRRYFLECIRASQACNELSWAGLFAYNGVTQSGPQSDSDIEQSRLRIAELSAQLRNALYNDEYMQYSRHR